MDNAILRRLFSLEGKGALVTGASGGIGGAIAEALAGAGARVALSGTNVERLQETRRRIEAEGGDAVIVRADLGTVAACRQLAADAQDALSGRLDILFNNAGTTRRRALSEFTEDDYTFLMDVNLRSAFFLSQAAHPLMRARGGGKIVNIGSMTSFVGLGTTGVYGMTKAALAQLTKTMAVEWAPDNIQVNCLAPGFILTPLTAAGLFGDPKRRGWIESRTPMRRPGTPEDLIGTALLLAAPASAFLTGQVIAVDGGFLAGGSWDAAEAI
jgi:NAD(P)-dependent dehydrogenase (short-subunit alcohol dehydrogenase family)